MLAVGTDLVYSAATKIVGAWLHSRQRTVDFQLARRLAIGSVPAGLAAVALIGVLADAGVDADQAVRRALGGVLVLIAVAMLGRMFALREQVLPERWRLRLEGKAYGGGTQRVDTNPKPQRLLYAIDLQTGSRKWELPQSGLGSTWGGTLATSTGLVFFGDDSGSFAAADAVSGKLLWSFQANSNWHASPMAYQFDGQQYIAIASGDDILVFGLLD